MNFELILTLATLVSFFFWLIHKYVFSNSVIDFFQSFFIVLLAVLMIRSFMFEPFRIPSSSMRPTLVIGDFVLVNKFSYGVRLPVLRTKILNIGEPERGDIVVFKFPLDTRIDYIKRVIGIPGDKIEVRGKTLLVNDKLVATEKIGERQWHDSECNTYESDMYKEYLPSKPHLIMHASKINTRRDSIQIVPAGKYFVMGDNRDNSVDSRYWGFLSEELLVGKAQAIWMNFDWTGDCAKGVQLNRIGGIESNH